ncbi:MAG: glycosyltransferase family 4 protein [Pirellulales bacterium]
MAEKPVGRRVAHLTSVHRWNDTRIYARMCRSLAEAGYDVHLVVAKDDLPANASAYGVTVHAVPEAKKGRWERATRTTKDVLEVARKLDADIYHLHDPELLPIGLKLRKQGKKVIYDAHEDLPATLVDKPWIPHAVGSVLARPIGWVEQRLASRMTAVIGAEERITVLFRRPGQPAISVHNYPRMADYPAPTDYRPRRESNLLVSFSGLNVHRCGDMVIRAASLLEPKYDYRLVIAGISDGESFLSAVRGLPAMDRMEYKGVLTRDQMNVYLYQARIAFVLYSNSPNHLHVRSNRFFEAMAAGVPVITADFPDWVQTVNGIGSGITVPSDDPAAIAQAVRKLWDDPDLAEHMGRQGRKAIEEKYNWEREQSRLLDLYRQLLGDG